VCVAHYCRSRRAVCVAIIGDEMAPAVLLVTDNGGIRHEAFNQFGGQVYTRVYVFVLKASHTYG
jgi:hypothetical protein